MKLDFELKKESSGPITKAGQARQACWSRRNHAFQTMATVVVESRQGKA